MTNTVMTAGVEQVYLEWDGSQQSIKGRLSVSCDNDKLVAVCHAVGVPNLALSMQYFLPYLYITFHLSSTRVSTHSTE